MGLKALKYAFKLRSWKMGKALEKFENERGREAAKAVLKLAKKIKGLLNEIVKEIDEYTSLAVLRAVSVYGVKCLDERDVAEIRKIVSGYKKPYQRMEALYICLKVLGRGLPLNLLEKAFNSIEELRVYADLLVEAEKPEKIAELYDAAPVKELWNGIYSAYVWLKVFGGPLKESAEKVAERGVNAYRQGLWMSSADGYRDYILKEAAAEACGTSSETIPSYISPFEAVSLAKVGRCEELKEKG